LRNEADQKFLDGLRARFEDEGYTFIAFPDQAELPAFLGAYVPDALARKSTHNIAIEIKGRRTASTEHSLRDVRRLFDGHPDWQLQVFYVGADPSQSATIPVADPARIRRGIDEVQALVRQGHPRSAFVTAWSLLEAAFRTLEGETASQPAKPGTVVQALAMRGYIGPDLDQRMRDLIALRNRVVHGDLSIEPTKSDVEVVLSALEETLSAEATKVEP
jgi:uncharacterized protein YutE (UPF0331/DUF86 family)